MGEMQPVPFTELYLDFMRKMEEMHMEGYWGLPKHYGGKPTKPSLSTFIHCVLGGPKRIYIYI